MDCANFWLLKANQWQFILTFPKTNHVQQLIKVNKEDKKLIPFIASNTRKRRRQDDSQKLPNASTQAIVAPYCIQIQCPYNFSQCCQSVVNALAGILPLDIRINLFGFAHSMILVGVLYKHQNLCWIVLNRMNYKLYIASHFVADALHLFAKHRNRLQFPNDRKWHRQGINEIMTLTTDYESRNAQNSKKIIRMNSLAKGILRFNHTTQSFFELTEFLRGVGASATFLSKFTRTQPQPPGFIVPNETLCQYANGWKVFKKPLSNQICKQDCLCEQTNVAMGQDLQESVINLISAVPSSLDKKAKNLFEYHFKDFIAYIKENPNLAFYPSKDILIT